MSLDHTTGDQQLRLQAELHASRKEWPQAIACFAQLHARRPRDAGVLLQLSYVESLCGKYRAARDHALQAQALRPDDPAILRELFPRLRTFNAAGAFRDCLRQLTG